jgi:hypothetical protein
MAAYERARLHAADGEAGPALALLEQTQGARPLPWRAHLLRARLLLARGRTEAALDGFEAAMQPDGVAPRFASLLPDDLEALQRRLADAAR